MAVRVKKPLALVTGGAGFIGCNLVREILARGRRVRVLDNLSTGRAENLAAVARQVDFVRGDIRRPAVCASAMEGVTHVFHLAALPSVARSVADPAAANAVNVTGTLNLLIAARDAGVRAFIYSSSSSVYGDTPRLPKRETMPETPRSPYAVSKLAAEKYCRVFAQLYGLPTVSLRYFNIYGPRQNPASEYAAVIPKFITRMLAGRPPVIFGDGGQTRDFTFVKDAVAANLLAAERAPADGPAINIGAGARFSLLQLAELLNGILGTGLVPVLQPPRPGDVRHSLAALDHAAEIIGYRPRFDFASGLRETVDFYAGAPTARRRR